VKGGEGCVRWVGLCPGSCPLGVDHARSIRAELTTSAAPSWHCRTYDIWGGTPSAVAAAQSTCAFGGSAEATTATDRLPELDARHEGEVGGTIPTRKVSAMSQNSGGRKSRVRIPPSWAHLRRWSLRTVVKCSTHDIRARRCPESWVFPRSQRAIGRTLIRSQATTCSGRTD